MRFLFVLSPLFLLTACAAPQGDFPSLAKRPYERQMADMAGESASPVASVPMDAAARQAMADALDRHRRGQAAFAAALGKAAHSVTAAHHAGAGSENWVAAQVALSRADVARGESVAAMADLDRLYITESEKGASIAGYTGADEIGAVRDDVARAVEGQSQDLQRLAERLGG